jgi:hypothetical protein
VTRKTQKTTTTTQTERPEARPAGRTSHQDDAPHEVVDNPLYGVAMLKIAMELKKPDAGALDDILQGVLARMNLSEDAFRRYLAKNGGLLRTIAQKKYS